MRVPFNSPFVTGKECDYIQRAITERSLQGNGSFTHRCQDWLEKRLGCMKAFITPSCTAALEMAGILAQIKAGDEIIMPSFTFVSTANPFVLRGGIPVFVDIRADTLNLDERQVEAAITARTKAIVAVHYAGVSCEMKTLTAIARHHRLCVIEDAAQAILSTYEGLHLGSLGQLAALSFHVTKNVTCGEGGALLINCSELIEPAEIVWEKGTNRAHFLRGEIDKYTWIDVGSSFLTSEITAAFLLAQLEEAEMITAHRMAFWTQYHEGFADLETRGKVRRPVVSSGCQHNAHIYYLLMPNPGNRDLLIRKLRDAGIQAAPHYVPLHNSPAGIKYGRLHGDLSVTQYVGDCLVRLPLWTGMTENMVQEVIEVTEAVVNKL